MQSTRPSSMMYITSPLSPSVMILSPAAIFFSTMASTIIIWFSDSRVANRKLCCSTFKIRCFWSSLFGTTGGLKTCCRFHSPYASADTEVRPPDFLVNVSGSSSMSSSSSSSSSAADLALPALASVSLASSSRTSSCRALTSPRSLSASPTPSCARDAAAPCLVWPASHLTMKGTGLSGLSRRTWVTRFSSVGFTFDWMYS
mmetsp:Transcript_104542/g.305206  ORF Transcript_104542/g.305206 Transcript_104542/m.305206 type:complete len:201 (+) Transcript_104542:721-1323(+)